MGEGVNQLTVPDLPRLYPPKCRAPGERPTGPGLAGVRAGTAPGNWRRRGACWGDAAVSERWQPGPQAGLPGFLQARRARALGPDNRPGSASRLAVLQGHYSNNCQLLLLGQIPPISPRGSSFCLIGFQGTYWNGSK